MSSWASLEFQLNNAVERFLGLKGIHGAILSHNIQIRDKQNIIRTFFDLYCGNDKAWMKSACKVMERIGSCNSDRNTVAHTPFVPRDNGSVEFLVVKAKGRLDIPTVIWSQDAFDAKEAEMEDLSRELDGLMDECIKRRNARIAQKPSLNPFLSFAGLPTLDNPAPGILSSLANLLPAGLDSPEPTTSEGTQTPQEPLEE